MKLSKLFPIIGVLVLTVLPQWVTADLQRGAFFISEELNTSYSANSTKNEHNSSKANASTIETSPESINYHKLAENFIRSKNDWFDSERFDLKLSRESVDDNGNRHFLYHFIYRNYRVAKTKIMVHLSANGKVFAVNGYMNHLSTLPALNGVIDREKARRSVIRTIVANSKNTLNTETANATIDQVEPLLVKEAPFIVWQVTINNLGSTAIYTVNGYDASVISKKTIFVH